MKQLVYIVVVWIPFLVFGQEMNISGNFQLHDGGQLGLHTNLRNNGTMVNETGSLVGFYSSFVQEVSGAIPPSFYDLELMTGGLILNTSITVENNLNFVLGQVFTPKNDPTIRVNMATESFYVGENDINYVDGYLNASDVIDYTFPLGDQNRLRSLILNSNGINENVSCTYLFENPSNPTSINQNFNTNTKTRDIGLVSTSEFWILDGEVESTITLSWNSRSNLSFLAEELNEIIIVGWNSASSQWVPLSGNTAAGDLNDGMITSNSFLPREFSAITFGTTPFPSDTFATNNPTLGDYFVSPNGDGINEFLVFDNLDETGSNVVLIYNKFGQKVFEQANYTNEFRGVANTGSFIIKQEIGLPEGIYYYTIDLPELNLAYQGFLFLDR